MFACLNSLSIRWYNYLKGNISYSHKIICLVIMSSLHIYLMCKNFPRPGIFR